MSTFLLSPDEVHSGVPPEAALAGADLSPMLGLFDPLQGGSAWPDLAQLSRAALAHNSGERRWRGWKQAQAEELAEFVGRTPRVQLVDLNLDGDFNAVVSLKLPVPRWPREGRLRVTDRALVHLNYQSQWLVDPPPPWMPVGVVWPHDLYLPNARPGPRGDVCLGAVAAGTPVLELLLLGAYALSLQTVMLDETEGVMNPQASEFYREHPELLPLTRTGLQEPWSVDDLPRSEALLVEGGPQP